MALIPKPTAPIAGALLITREWWNYLSQIPTTFNVDGLTKQLSDIQKELAELSGSGAGGEVRGILPIVSHGTLAGGLVQISLDTLPDAGGGELLKIVREPHGLVAGTSQAFLADLADVSSGIPALGNALQWTGAQWEPKTIEAGVNNLDGGRATSVYGGTTAINGGGA